KDIYEWMLLPDDFGGSEDNNLYIRIKTMDDVVKARDDSEQFCVKHGIEDKRALYCALFIEEMAGNVVLHGKRKRFNSVCCDFRLFINENKISITLRDYCRQFDPSRYIEQNQNEEKGLGIKLVKSLSSEFRYFSAFNSNNLIIVID
ncbi:MAG: ATP-binding protein, partial [Spirochaetales bacterium]|nr:ATP-binding protein [Spirochaetales bacterium]